MEDYSVISDLKTPPSEEEKAFTENIKTKAKQNGDIRVVVIEYIEKSLAKSGIKFVLTPHASKSNLRILAFLASYPVQNPTTFRIFIPSKKQKTNLFDIKKNKKVRLEVQNEIKWEVANTCNCPIEKVFIIDVKEEGVKLECLTEGENRINEGKIYKALREKYGTNYVQILKSEEYTFRLSLDDFEPKGDYDFPNSAVNLQKRGGEDYYQPNNSYNRIGLQVLNIFPENYWLGMDGNPNEWAVAFHGINLNPNFEIPKLANQEGLKKVSSQANLSNVAKGVYCCQRIDICENGYVDEKIKFQDSEYSVLFQSRVRPSAIKKTEFPYYWLINDPNDLRPYGVVLRKSTENILDVLKKKYTQEEKTYTENAKSKAKQNEEIVVIVIEYIENSLANVGINFILTSNPSNSNLNILSFLASKSIQNSSKFRITIPTQGQGINTNEIQKNNSLRLQFEDNLRREVAKVCGTPIENVFIIEIRNEVIKVECLIEEVNRRNEEKIFENLKEKYGDDNVQLKSEEYTFRLSLDDFDARGNFQFPHPKGDLLKRGGRDYYQPNSTYFRLGLRVLNKFSDNYWLRKDGHPQEWAVAFHGINHNPEFVFPKIIKEGLKIGQRQAYENEVGKGVYCSPRIDVCETGYTNQKLKFQDSEYSVIFQCRVRPSAIKQTSNQDYWVINDPADIRPYGVVLKKKIEEKK